MITKTANMDLNGKLNAAHPKIARRKTPNALETKPVLESHPDRAYNTAHTGRVGHFPATGMIKKVIGDIY